MRIYNYQDGVKKLGPGIRFVLWTQGCPRSCVGCMTPASQDINGGKQISVEELSQIIINANREGITISGGEPFLQSDDLCELITLVKKSIDIGVIIYTGYTYEELVNSKDSGKKRLLELTDLLIDGPYVDELNDGMNLRGSSNQRVIALTDRYEQNVCEYGTKNAEIEIFMKENKMVMVGVPTKELLDKFKNVFEEDM